VPWNPNFTLQPQPEFAEGAPKQYEYNDLKAQENMARATNIIAWATVITVFTSIFGVWLLVSNLKVIGETNSIMRLDQRPWLRIDPSDYFGPSDPDGNGRLVMSVGYKIKNVGKSPAFRVSATIRGYRHDSNTALKDHANSLVLGSFIPQDAGAFSIIFPDEEIIRDKRFYTLVLDDEARRNTSLIFMLVYATSQGAETLGCDIRCYRLIQINENGEPTTDVRLEEIASARVTK
jgi:hypothetical protein